MYSQIFQCEEYLDIALILRETILDPLNDKDSISDTAVMIHCE